MAIKIDPKSATKEQIARGLELFAQEQTRKERIARGEIKGGQKWSELSPETKAKRLEGSKRYGVKQRLLARRAVEAGIVVTDAEIDAEIAKA